MEGVPPVPQTTGEVMLTAVGTPDCSAVFPVTSGLVHTCPWIEADAGGGGGEVRVSSLNCLTNELLLSSAG